jgi:hypothetical protein
MPVAKAGAVQVAKLLRKYAQRIALRGGNPYHAKAYVRARTASPRSSSRWIGSSPTTG